MHRLKVFGWMGGYASNILKVLYGLGIGVLGVYGTCRLVLLLSKATGTSQGHCPAGPKGLYCNTFHYIVEFTMQYSIQCIACSIECCIALCLTGTFGIMTVFNLVFDLPTSHRNVLEMVFRVIQIANQDFPKNISDARGCPLCSINDQSMKI